MTIDRARGQFTCSDFERAVGDVLSLYKREASEASEASEACEACKAPALSTGSADMESLRSDFPILSTKVNGKPLIWLDNAATTQKPGAVIDRLTFFYERENSNVHRGAHALAAAATDAYEGARDKIRRFIGAASSREIVFVRGATEGINLAAASYGRQNLGEGDEILVSCLEHHANIVPWQMLCASNGAALRVIPAGESGQIDIKAYEALLGPKTKLVAVTYVSNSLGIVTPVREMVAMAHRHGARVLIDAAQAVPHFPVDVRALDCDFLVFSGHKLFGPTGVGVLYGKAELLDAMTPYQGGGNMIDDVTFEKATYQQAPRRFEAGTGPIAAAVGLGAAVDYLNRVGMDRIAQYERHLYSYASQALACVPGLSIIGTADEKAGVISFTLGGIPDASVGRALDNEGIAVRTGHHCSLPILRRFGVESTVRVSLAFYNTYREIDALADALWKLATPARLR